MTRISAVDRRAALVRAALRVVARDGVSAATTRSIVAEAGMSLASFHYAFASRDELMVELINAVVDGEETALAPALQPVLGGVTIRDAVRGGLQNYFDAVRADPDREKAMFELTQWALREPGFEPLARRQYDRYFAVAERALVAAASLTGCVWRGPTAEIARMLVVLTDGLTIAWLVTRDDAAAAATMDFAADAVADLATPARAPLAPHPNPNARTR
ncbi:TetR/AcrR family transcriptional regulator [Leifsonia poae]|uniref:TetR/AcrR family transcriptional regulator n=1 Tax=Leifsonia poae TaxID=110933 RepID=UPI001CC18493|nr:TetR family transcriptional regulator [Leifsonia poae]